MTDNRSQDPWDSLADSLGASPGGDPPPAPKPAPAPAARRDKPPARRSPPPSPATGDWDSLAAELGVQSRGEPLAPRPAASRPTIEPRPAAPQPPAAAERRQAERRQAEEPQRDRRPSLSEHGEETVRAGGVREVVDDERQERPVRQAGDESNPDGEGSVRRRRRRGRRGGRGRRREDDRVEGGGDRGRPEGQARADDHADQPRSADRPRRAAPRLPRPSEHHSESETWRDDLDAHALDEGPSAGSNADATDAAPTARGESSDGDDDRPRGRRRRGRRGGRGRGRGRSDGGESGGERPARPAAAADDRDDEPLPTSYGMRPTDRPEAGQPAPAAGESGRDGAARERGRRRRSRRGGDERRREPSSERPAGRGESRRQDGPRSPRGRRGDFEPVAGRHEEDDEGLEFLGVEEAARAAERRPRPTEDDVLAESGLNEVLDVPSWVEAIGIVIASNLAARTRSGRGGEGGKGR